MLYFLYLHGSEKKKKKKKKNTSNEQLVARVYQTL
jgi:hypothetical protein